jgi:anti-sigma B factor antagonist
MDPGTAPAPGLSFSARTAGSIAIAEIGGELDITCSPALRDQLLSLLRRSSSQLVVDLSKVTYCDASGLAVLVGTGRRARLLGGHLHLAAVPPQVDHVLQITGLHRHLDVFATVQAAIASLEGAPHRTMRATARDRAVDGLPRPVGGHAVRSWASADFGQLREVTAALLSHADAWHDADPSRRFTTALGAMARAWGGSDDTALEAAARSLMSALARHPLAHSQAVAASATRLRRVLDAGCRSVVT